MRSAFAVLQQASKRSSTSKLSQSTSKKQRRDRQESSTPSSQLSSFLECPVCSAHIPRALAQEHAAQCLDNLSAAKQDKQDLQTSTAKSLQLTPSMQPDDGQATPAATPGSSAAAGCSMGPAAPDFYSDRPPSAAVCRAQQHRGQAPQNELQNTSDSIATACQKEGRSLGNNYDGEPAPHQPLPSVPTQPPANNALLALMQSSRLLSQGHVFFLELCEGGKFTWHWWSNASASSAPSTSQASPEPSGAPPTECADRPKSKSVWSATTQVATARLTGRAAKLDVKLMTSDAGGAVTWQTAGLASNAAGPDGRYHGSVSLLKSALQKNVRLCRPASAVRCAAALIKEDAGEFLRRMSIICLEDGVLHPSLPLLVWLMAATAKGYRLGHTACTACLAVVHQVAAVHIREELSAGPHSAAEDVSAASCRGQVADPFCNHGLTGQAACLVNSLLVRAAYGGMRGDMDMLTTGAALWTARLSGNIEPPNFVPPSPANLTAASALVSPQTPQLDEAPNNQGWLVYLQRLYNIPADIMLDTAHVEPLRRADIPVSAVDFHVSNIIDELMQNAEIRAAADNAAGPGGDPQQALQRAMWRFRSSTSKKMLLSHQEPGVKDGGALEQLWRIAGGPADAWSAQHIRRRFF